MSLSSETQIVSLAQGSPRMLIHQFRSLLNVAQHLLNKSASDCQKESSVASEKPLKQQLAYSSHSNPRVWQKQMSPWS